MNERQKEIMTFIEDYIDTNGYAPSYREIQEKVGLKSLSTVKWHINQLINTGFITCNPHISRSITVQRSLRKPATMYDKMVSDFNGSNSPLKSPDALAIWLAHIQLSETRDAAEWLEYLTKPCRAHMR